MAKKDKMLLPEKRKLTALLLGIVKSLGGVQVAPPSEKWWDIETPFGKVQVSVWPDEDWLPCRFYDCVLGNAKMGDVCGKTGKYNTYVFERISAEGALEKYYKPHLAYIWTRAGQPTPECLK